MTDSGLIFQKEVETYWAMLGKGWWGMGCAAAHCAAAASAAIAVIKVMRFFYGEGY